MEQNKILGQGFNMENVIVILILVAIAAAIICYLVRAKRRGDKCVGCPYCKECKKKNCQI